MLEEFINLVPLYKQEALIEWWNSLSAPLQKELQIFYEHGDSVLESSSLINQELYQRAIVEMEADELRDLAGFEFPNQDYYENLVGNEVYLCLRGPVFHICKAHQTLRAYLMLGFLPMSFSCFIKNSNCAMVKYLNAGKKGFWGIKCKLI